MYDRIVEAKRSNFFFVETIFVLTLLLAINTIFFPNLPAFKGIDPNPLWIVVIMIPARYGRNAGLFASTMASAFFLSFYAAKFGIDIFFEEPMMLRYPFLFFLVGFLLGEIKHVFILRTDYLTNRLTEVQNLNDKLAEENELIKDAHKHLSQEMATRQDSLSFLYQITSKFDVANFADIYKSLLDSLISHLGVEECSLYEREGNILVLREKRGWQDYHRRPESIEIGNGLVGIAAKTLNTKSIKDFVLRREMPSESAGDVLGDSVLAIPIVGPYNKLYGVVSVEKMPLLKMTDSSIQTARIICELAATSMKNANVLKSMQESQIENPELGLFKYHYFLNRLDAEMLRSLNYMLPLSVVACHWPVLARREQERQAALLRSIANLIKSKLRAFDVLATGPIPEVPLVLLLATTAKGQAEELKARILEKVEEYNLGNLLTESSLDESIRVQDYNPHTMSTSHDMLEHVGL